MKVIWDTLKVDGYDSQEGMKKLQKNIFANQGQVENFWPFSGPSKIDISFSRFS